MRVALQMDPIETIKVDGDSTYLIGLGAQELGHRLYYYQPKDLFWQEGVLYAHAHPLTLSRDKSNYFVLGAPTVLNLQSDVDVILLRQDPPFHTGYLTTTYLLEQIAHKVRVLNSPVGVRNAPEKLMILPFAQYMPPTLIARNEESLRAFADKHKRVVAKKIYSNGGRDVFLFAGDDPALFALAATHGQETGEPLMVQAYLPEVEQGDKRIILYNGKVAGAIKRLPAKGNFLANLAQGGTAQKTELTPREEEICAALAPLLRREGLYFAGLDIIGDSLIEVNVTSPTGLASINALYGLTGDARMEIRFWKELDQ